MKTEVITAILQQMAPHLKESQMAELKGALYICLQDYEIRKKQTDLAVYEDDASVYLRRFLLERGAAGLSQETLDNYKLTLEMFLQATNKPVTQYTDEDIICYLEVYRRVRKVSFARIKNMQSAMSSFFGWLCRRKYIQANPVAQMDSIKVPKKIKHPFTAEAYKLPAAKRHGYFRDFEQHSGKSFRTGSHGQDGHILCKQGCNGNRKRK